MWKIFRTVLLVGAFAAELFAFAPHASANEDVSACDDLAKKPENTLLAILCIFEFLEQVFGPPIAGEAAQSGIATPIVGIQRLTTVDGTLQAGEPREPGMTRTGWVGFRAAETGRVVIHTFGSTAWDSGVFDPLLAVYRGTALSNLVRIAGNDNKPLPGISSVDSLVQFNAVAGTDYRVQVGSRNGIEGEVELNVFSFPPTGGLSAFLLKYNSVPFNGRDYSCDFFTGPSVSITCPSAQFIVHNSTDGALTVAASSSLGAGVTASPASFVLTKGALKVVTFTFGPNFNHTTPRTLSGRFIFTGKAHDKVVAQAHYRALVIARPGSPVQDLIASRSTPTVQTAHVNVPVTFTSTVTNSGGVNAIGCHFRSVLYSDLKTTFYTINPANGARLTTDDVPVNIAPGQSRTFRVSSASQGARDADFIDPEIIADCANNQRTQSGLRGGFDFSASAVALPLPAIGITAVSPGSGVLNVPPSGFAYFAFRAANTATAARLDVLPAYVSPFDDPADTDYTVAICRTNLGTGNCVTPYASSVSYTATKGATFGFSVRVKAPTGAPAFDPDKRRVFVNFKLADAPYYHLAAPSIAVRKQ